jgi:hypothetical protein
MNTAMEEANQYLLKKKNASEVTFVGIISKHSFQI